MPKPKPSRKIIKQEMLWPTPYWYTHIWEFIRSETRVTFNEDMIGSIQGMMDKDKGVKKSNRGGWQSELLPPTGELEPLAFEISEKDLHRSKLLNIINSAKYSEAVSYFMDFSERRLRDGRIAIDQNIYNRRLSEAELFSTFV